MKEKYKKVQDNDSHWYWIPNELLEEFEAWNNMNTETDEFMQLIDKFEDYRTYGHPDETPSYWLLKEELLN